MHKTGTTVKSYLDTNVISATIKNLTLDLATNFQEIRGQKNMLKDIRGCSEQNPDYGKLQDKWLGFFNK